MGFGGDDDALVAIEEGKPAVAVEKTVQKNPRGRPRKDGKPAGSVGPRVAGAQASEARPVATATAEASEGAVLPGPIVIEHPQDVPAAVAFVLRRRG